MDLDHGTRRLIARLVLGYGVVAGLWIVVSDQLLGLFVQIADMTYLATVKGLVFVLFSSLFVYLALSLVARHAAQPALMPADSSLADSASAAPFAPAQGYAFAILLTCATFLLRFAIDLPLSRPMLILFMLPITLSALLGGAGPGLLATALTLIGECVTLVRISPLDVSALRLVGVQMFVLVASGVVVSFASRALHRSRQRAELALIRERDARDDYRILSDQLRDPVWRKDRAGRYIDCNEPFLGVVGRSRDQIIGSTDEELFNTAVAAEWRAEDLRVMESLQAVEQEEYWPEPSTTGWVLVSKTPVLDGQGHCIGTLGIARDINRRRAVERALKESEALFRTLFEIGQDAVLIGPLQADGSTSGFIEVNAEALRLFGYPRSTLLGKTLADLLDQDAGDDACALLHEVMRDGQAQRLATARAADGRCFPVELSIIRFEQGSAGGYAAMMAIRDISARLASENEQARLHDQVAQMQKLEAIGQLTGGISHDFNNLLATVLGYTELAHLHVAGRADPKLEQYLEAVRTAAVRGRDLVSKMLVFSRGSAREGTAPLTIVPRPVVSSALELLRSAIPSSIAMDIHLDDISDGVPCDAVEIEQLLMNLVINARDAISGAGRITVTLREVQVTRDTCSACLSDYSGDFVELAVADSGSGIAPHLLPNIFEPFFTTKEVGRGTGLGLALVRLRLPRVVSHGEASRALAATPSSVAVSSGPRDAHVMVVDDELALGRYWCDLLESEGYRVSVFSDSRAALAAFEAAPEDFDAVLSDLTMPHLSGESLAGAMLARRADTPIFLLSGNLAGFDAKTVAALGVRQCFKKPADSAEILAALDTALAQALGATDKP